MNKVSPPHGTHSLEPTTLGEEKKEPSPEKNLEEPPKTERKISFDRSQELTGSLLKQQIESKLQPEMPSQTFDEQLQSLPPEQQIVMLGTDVRHFVDEHPPAEGLTWGELYSRGPQAVSQFYNEHPEALKTAVMIGGALLTLASGGTTMGVMGSALRFASYGETLSSSKEDLGPEQRGWDQFLADSIKWGAVGVSLAVSGPVSATLLGVTLFGESLLPQHWKNIVSATLSGPSSLGKWMQEIGKTSTSRWLVGAAKEGFKTGTSWVSPLLSSISQKGVKKTISETTGKVWTSISSLFSRKTTPEVPEKIPPPETTKEHGYLTTLGLTASDLAIQYAVTTGQLNPSDALELQAKLRLGTKTVELGTNEDTTLSKVGMGIRLAVPTLLEGTEGLKRQALSEITWHLPSLQTVLSTVTSDRIVSNQNLITKALELGSETDLMNALYGVPDVARVAKDLISWYQTVKENPLLEQPYRGLAERIKTLALPTSEK